MDQPVDLTQHSAGGAQSSVGEHVAATARKLAAARAGSTAAVDELFFSCRNYLLLIANATCGDSLQGKVAASDLVRETFLEGARNFEQFSGQSEEELLRWLTRILENKRCEVHECLRLLQSSAVDERLRKNASAETVALAVNGQPVEFEAIWRPSNLAPDTSLLRETRFGRFEIVSEIGRGGHGVVFLARDPVLNRLVALKVPQPEVLLSPSMRRRFLAEGRAAAILAHPNLVTVYEAGEVGPVCYIAQAYISGTTLHDWLTRRTTHVPPEIAATIVAQLADGVAHAHSRGILHRDLKPGNVLLDMDGEHERVSAVVCPDEQISFVPKITDFGIAKSLEFDGNETATGTVLGTASYMSPEQATGDSRRVGPAADIYSLGAILYELLTRQAAFRGDTYVDTLRLVASVEATAPRRLRDDVPRDLEAICLKCLEKDPARRYASAFELAADLRRFLAGEPTVARPVSKRERVVRWCRRNPASAGLVGVSVAAILSLMAMMFWSNVRLGRQLEETIRERSRAEANEQLANQREFDAKNRAYAADMRLIVESFDFSSTSTTEALLQPYVPADGTQDIRGFEWWLYHRLLTNDAPSKELGVHENGVQSVAVNVTGDLAASGGGDGIVRLWRIPSGEPAGELQGHNPGTINSLAFSPDGMRLASASDDRTVKVWDVPQRKALLTLKGHEGWVGSVIFVAEGKALASGASDGAIIVWDSMTGKEKTRLIGQSDAVRALALHKSSGVLFSSAEDATIRAWDIDKGAPSTLVHDGILENASRSWIRCLAFEPDQTSLLAVPFSGDPFYWVLRPGQFGIARHWKGASKATHARSVALGGRRKKPTVVFGLEDSRLQISPYNKPEDFRILRGHRDIVDAIALTANASAILSGSRDGSVRLWDTQSSMRTTRDRYYETNIHGVTLSPDGRQIAIAVNDQTQLLDFDTLNPIQRFYFPSSNPAILQFSPHSFIAAAWSTDQPLRIFAADGTVSGIPLLSSKVSRIRFSPDGAVLAAIEKNQVWLIDLGTKGVRGRLATEDDISDIVFVDGDTLLGSCRDGCLYRWSVRDARLLNRHKLAAGGLEEMAVDLEGARIAVRGFHRVDILDLHALEPVASLPHRIDRGEISFLAGGKTLLTADNPSYPLLWQTNTWQQLGPLNVTHVPISSFVSSANGFRLVTYDRNRLTALDAEPPASELP